MSELENTIHCLKQRAKEMLEGNNTRVIGAEEIYTIICEWEQEKEKNKELEKLFKKIDNDINTRKLNLEGMYELGYNECKMDYIVKIKKIIEKIKKYRDSNDSVDENGYIQIGFIVELLEKELLLEEEQ